MGTITRAAFTAGLDRILLVGAIIAFVAGVVSLAAIRSRDFARAAPSSQEGPPELRRPDGQARRPDPAESQQPTTAAAARAVGRPGLPDDM